MTHSNAQLSRFIAPGVDLFGFNSPMPCPPCVLKLRSRHSPNNTGLHWLTPQRELAFGGAAKRLSNEEKQAKNRLFVKRCYYKKREALKNLREEVAQLENELALVLQRWQQQNEKSAEAFRNGKRRITAPCVKWCILHTLMPAPAQVVYQGCSTKKVAHYSHHT